MMRTSWIVTFADLAAILAAFFVLYVSMTTVNADKAELLAQLFGRDEGQWQSLRPVAAPDVAAVERADDSALETEHYLATVIRERAAVAGWNVRVRSADGAVLLENLDPAQIDSGLAEYLARLGLGLSVVALVPAGPGNDGFGPHEAGLRQGAILAGALAVAGLSGRLPVVSRGAAEIDGIGLHLRIELPRGGQP